MKMKIIENAFYSYFPYIADSSQILEYTDFPYIEEQILHSYNYTPVAPHDDL